MSKGAFPPTWRGSARGCKERFPCGRVLTLAQVPAQFEFAVPFRGTGSLIYQYRPTSAPYSCGSCIRIAPWAISAGAHSGPAAEAQRTRGGINITHFLQTDPLRNPLEICTRPLVYIDPRILLNTCIPGKKYNLFEQYFLQLSYISKISMFILSIGTSPFVVSPLCFRKSHHFKNC